MLMRLIKILLICLFSSQNILAYKLNIFDLHKNYPSPCENSPKECFTLENLIKRSLEFSTEVREEVQLVYQADATTKIKLGQILPQADPLTAVTAGIDASASVDNITPLLGILFINRWFDWKASRRLRHAEQEILNTILANRAQTVQSLYFDIHKQTWSIRILEFYIREIDNLIIFLKSQNRNTLEAIAVLENIKGKLIYDRAYVDALSATYPQLASAVGLAPNFDWSDLKIDAHSVASLSHEKTKEYKDFWPKAQARSTEIKSAEYFLQAGIKNKKIPYFDFFDPATPISLDMGYVSRIKSAQSNVEVLNIRLLRTQMQLSNAIHNALNNYNDAVLSFSGIENALHNLEDIKISAEENINNTEVPLDINKINRYLRYSKITALSYVASYFNFLSAQADLNRYTWDGKIYEMVKNFITVELPTIQKEAKKQLRFRRSLRWQRFAHPKSHIKLKNEGPK